MTTWTSDEPAQIGSAEELDIAPGRSDGSLARPRTIWVVRHGDDVDSVYREKHRRYAASIVSPQARAATLKLVLH